MVVVAVNKFVNFIHGRISVRLSSTSSGGLFLRQFSLEESIKEIRSI